MSKPIGYSAEVSERAASPRLSTKLAQPHWWHVRFTVPGPLLGSQVRQELVMRT